MFLNHLVNLIYDYQIRLRHKLVTNERTCQLVIPYKGRASLFSDIRKEKTAPNPRVKQTPANPLYKSINKGASVISCAGIALPALESNQQLADLLFKKIQTVIGGNI